MASDERVEVVDGQNRVLRVAERWEVRRDNLPHRATYIVIEDETGRLYVQRRTQSKDYCPGKLDACCGGVVLAGEAYLPSAYRELAEEMGIEGVALTDHGEFYWEDAQCKVWGGLFSCRYEGALRLQAEEVEYVLRLTVAEILARAPEFTPDSIAAIRHWCRLTGRTEV